VFIKDNGEHYRTLIFRGVPEFSEATFKPQGYDTKGLERKEMMIILDRETTQLHSGDILVSHLAG